MLGTPKPKNGVELGGSPASKKALPLAMEGVAPGPLDVEEVVKYLITVELLAGNDTR